MYRVSPEAEELALKDLNVTREKRRRIQAMTKDELQRYLVHLYRGGFEDGVNTVQEKLAEEADIEPEDDVTEIQVSWEDVLAVIGQVRGIGPKTLAEIDKALKEKY